MVLLFLKSAQTLLWKNDCWKIQKGSVSITSESHLLGLDSPQGNYKYETIQHDIILLIKITLYYAPLTLALEDL